MFENAHKNMSLEIRNHCIKEFQILHLPHNGRSAAQIEGELHVTIIQAQRDVIAVLLMATVQQETVLRLWFDDQLNGWRRAKNMIYYLELV